MQRMTRRVQEAAQGSGVAADALKQLRLDASQLAKLRPDEQFKRVAERLAQVSDSGERVALAFKLFDSEGVRVLQMTKNLNAELAKTNSEWDADKTKQAADFNNAMTEFRQGAMDLAVNVLPLLTEAMKAVTTATDFWGKAFKQVSDNIKTNKIEILSEELVKLINARDKISEGGTDKASKFFGWMLGIDTKEKQLANYTKRIEEVRAELQKLVGTPKPKLPPTEKPKDGGGGEQLTEAELRRRQKALQAEEEYKTKVIDIRKKLVEKIKELEIERLQFNDMNLEAELKQIDNNWEEYLKIVRKGTEDEKKLVETIEAEKQLVRDRYRKIDEDKRSEELKKRLEEHEKMMDKERERRKKAMKEVLDAEKEAAKEREELAKRTQEFFATRFADTFTEIITGTKNAKDAFKEMITSMLADLTRLLAQKAFMMLLGSIGGGGAGGGIFASLGTIFGMAGGGTAKAGRPYVVGENGPELFVPNQTGTVVPNGAMGGSNISVSVNVDASNSNVGDPAKAQELGNNIARIVDYRVKTILAQEKRYGGILRPERRYG